MKMRFLGLAICLIALGSLAAIPVTISNRPREEAYQDSSTGVVMPAEVGSYRKLEVHKNANPCYGTTIRYANENASCADIYIYSLDAKETPADLNTAHRHFMEVRHKIEELPKTPESPISEVTVTADRQEAAQNPPNWRTTFLISIKEDQILSDLVVFPFKGKVVKIRISYPSDVPAERTAAMEFAETALRLFAAVPADVKK